MDALAERLESAGGSDSLVNLKTAGWMMGQGQPSVDRCVTPERFVRGYHERKLNPRQRQAIEQSLGSELTFIWGPPGTGKTDVVASVIEGCYRQGLRVLFVAPTKVAVDQALKRICELLSGEEGFDMGLVQRAGDIELASLSARFGEQISARRIAERLATAVAARIAERLATAVAARITETRELLDAARRDLALHAEVEQVTNELKDLHARRDEAGRHSTALPRQIHAEQSATTMVERQIFDTGAPSGFFVKKKQAKLDDLHRSYEEHRNTIAALDQQLRAALAAQQHCTTEITKREPELAVLRNRLRRVPSAKPLREAVERLQQQLTSLEQEQQKIEEAVRGNCRVMGTTVAKAVQSRKLLDSIDVVVIDEAGMVNTPSAWCAAGLATRRVVIAGDFRQLPAVTKASGDRRSSAEDKQHVALWMDRDVFATAGLVDQAGSARQDRRMVSLDTQYRMRPEVTVKRPEPSGVVVRPIQSSSFSRDEALRVRSTRGTGLPSSHP
ncbi:AAA domain-containing protein [Streptosporangium subroseum]|uniref:AAA domain-containing protein n=1 Tax=Streptosporangium subroseum TaxID=106412 RepID=A0A239ABZ2_9ACTN|nr:AAA domain-containing protein [Streptosporangium subroseum]SNR93176.1 AAA domain-containing protein [Streptosporangium subroseum]